MNNFGRYITPEEAFAFAKEHKTGQTLNEFKQMAKIKGLCDVCETEEIWRYVDNDMCFTCTTGEADASEDSELIADY